MRGKPTTSKIVKTPVDAENGYVRTNRSCGLKLTTIRDCHLKPLQFELTCRHALHPWPKVLALSLTAD